MPKIETSQTNSCNLCKFKMYAKENIEYFKVGVGDKDVKFY